MCTNIQPVYITELGELCNGVQRRAASGPDQTAMWNTQSNVRVYSFTLYDDRYLSNIKQFPQHNTTNSANVHPENNKPFSCDLNKAASVGNKRSNILLYLTFCCLA